MDIVATVFGYVAWLLSVGLGFTGAALVGYAFIAEHTDERREMALEPERPRNA